MIQVNATSNENTIQLEVEGHADYNPGNDIVCSAISALAMCFVGGVRATGQLISYRADSGDFFAEAEAMPKSHLIFNTILIGMLQVAKTYPENVKINIIPNPVKKDIKECAKMDLNTNTTADRA
jgi:uncharacterized protein YsxB (DUF464 family)